MKKQCLYCEKTFTNPLTRDHIIPLSRKPVASITIAVCKTCNQFKGGDTPLLFIGRMETVIKNFKRIVNATRESLVL